ncbi:Hypothetical predicted protein [Octopus vulgaris]|uniref:Uncharacterized protein n=1 Tax=Octopus vulgaris TaxID=6645 RepID=A0AA36AFX3_OCTVU|nr:Hypothetical predicted protein [Octopus vulgaris]
MVSSSLQRHYDDLEAVGMNRTGEQNVKYYSCFTFSESIKVLKRRLPHVIQDPPDFRLLIRQGFEAFLLE